MYHVSADGVDNIRRMVNVHFYYYLIVASGQTLHCSARS